MSTSAGNVQLKGWNNQKVLIKSSVVKISIAHETIRNTAGKQNQDNKPDYW
jgi:hypothetical protein